MYLNNHSYYSLRYGTLSIESLVSSAKSMGIQMLALTDINNSMGMVDFVRECGKQGIKPIAGVEFRNGDQLQYVGLARSNGGFRELNELLTRHNLSGDSYPELAPPFDEVFVIYPAGSRKPSQLRDNEFLGVRISQVSRLLNSDLRFKQEKLVLMQPVSFSDEKSWYVHQNLRAIDHNCLLSKLGPDQFAAADEIMLPPLRLRAAFALYPGLLKTTEKLAEACAIDFDFTTIKNKKNFTGNVSDDRELLHKLAYDGLAYRYGKTNATARKRVENELDIIDKLGFSAYFLITWDVIRYSMSRGFYHVGRGSGANSVVAYCLRITDVDPIELDLYFERFLNPKRSSPPDFDIDYSWKERDEVIDYIFKRYGSKYTALLGTISTFRGKSIYRELGKVHGLPKQEIDELVSNPGRFHTLNKITRHIHELAKEIVDFPNQRSIHAGGILISEEPLTNYVALDMPPKGFLTTQWDMYVSEDLGYEKLDILSQRGIGHIKDAADIIRENRRITIDVHQIQQFKDDPKVKDQLRRAETNGCFYIESPAMRGLLRKLQCDNYLTLVAASSIIRPGVAKSGMMREYINRFHHPESFSYIHPVMKEQLKETYGVMVYQEDVLKVCHHFAGLDLADADVLRRIMSGKKRKQREFEAIIDRFFSNCSARGYPEEITKEVWRQIESFAGYSFSKAHSASYAVESFQSLFLKAHYPLEFQVAVINNFGGFYHTWVYFNEARRQGGFIHLPCINQSHYLTSLRDTTVYIGFIHVAGMEEKLAQQLIEERKKRGHFKDLHDFIDRLKPGMEQLILLIRAGAFAFTGQPKPGLLWESHLYRKKSHTLDQAALLFKEQARHYQLPNLDTEPLEDAYDELELMGFPVSMTDFEMLVTHFRGEAQAEEMLQHVGKRKRMLGKLVTIKYVKTVRGELMHFGTFLDYQGAMFDTVHFPPSLKQYPFQGAGVYLLLGRVVEEFGYPMLEVEKMARLPVKKDPREG
ncbi:MAG: DNA polymerase III subunit alpha [Bacteroidetes bacterium]|jgi:DNA-directed DNA polymerase III PolC|nr:DNA polymerase III subunit alpha [Bacteroidota bacterium]